MKHDIVVTIIDRKTNATIAARAFPSASSHPGELHYIAVAATPHGGIHWAELTITGDSEAHIVASDRTFGVRPVHEGRYKVKDSFAIISYPIEERWAAVVEIKPPREVKRSKKPAAPRALERKGPPKPVGESYVERLLRLVGLGRSRTRPPAVVMPKIDARTLARVRRA